MVFFVLLWRFVSILEDKKGFFVKASKLQSGRLALSLFFCGDSSVFW
jgi:hypothetical protein